MATERKKVSAPPPGKLKHGTVVGDNAAAASLAAYIVAVVRLTVLVDIVAIAAGISIILMPVHGRSEHAAEYCAGNCAADRANTRENSTCDSAGRCTNRCACSDAPALAVVIIAVVVAIIAVVVVTAIVIAGIVIRVAVTVPILVRITGAAVTRFRS